MTATLQVVFDCHTLPKPGVPMPICQRLGIQEGKEVVQDVPYEAQTEIRLQIPIQVEVDPANGTKFFKGKYVQGPRTAPFIYLCWGDRSDGAWDQWGRAKIPLGAIPGQQIQQALQDGSLLRARIGLTDSRGNPACATLKADHVAWMEKL